MQSDLKRAARVTASIAASSFAFVGPDMIGTVKSRSFELVAI